LEDKELQDWLKKGGQGIAGLAVVERTRDCRTGGSREDRELHDWLE
jgi:hypothetical protein